MSNIWFTSDTHFYHHSMIGQGWRKRHDGYPFGSMDEMNELLITEWNSVVGHQDHIYHLGDFAFSTAPRAVAIIKRLNGNKFLIRGNHDNGLVKKESFKECWGWIKDLYTLRVHDKEINPLTGGERQFHQAIVMCHFPLLVWDGCHYGAWHLHGHSHGNLPDTYEPRIDVGIDAVANYGAPPYRPVSYEWVKEKMKLRKFLPKDHHA